jgi:hypothetical protein
MTERDCSYGEMTLKYVLWHCEKWNREREETIGKLRTKNLQSILSSRQGTKAVTEFVLRTILLEQFNLGREMKVREERKERRERGEKRERKQRGRGEIRREDIDSVRTAKEDQLVVLHDA